MNNLLVELKYHYSINKKNYYILVGAMIVFMLFNFFVVERIPGDGVIGMVLIFAYVAFGIPPFGIFIVMKSHKKRKYGVTSFALSIFSPAVIITLLYLFYSYATSIINSSSFDDLLGALVLPLFGLIGLFVLTYFYIELSKNINWKKITIRTALFLLYLVVYYSIRPFIAMENIYEVGIGFLIIFSFDIAIYLFWNYHKEFVKDLN